MEPGTTDGRETYCRPEDLRPVGYEATLRGRSKAAAFTAASGRNTFVSGENEIVGNGY